MKTIFLDAGHGGINPETGEYTTGQKKRYFFKDKNIHALEGVINRQFAESVKLSAHPTTRIIMVSDPWKDSSVGYRVQKANDLYKEGMKDSIFISLHNNASPKHNADGLEIWTSEGETKSDKYATSIYNEMKLIMPERKFRTGFYGDNDPDRESPFYVLRKTLMPAVLFEFGFFDEWEDYKLITDKTYQRKCACAIIHGINKVKWK